MIFSPGLIDVGSIGAPPGVLDQPLNFLLGFGSCGLGKSGKVVVGALTLTGGKFSPSNVKVAS